MSTRKFALASLGIESNSFSPQKSDLKYFHDNGFILYKDQILPYHQHVKNEIAGFIDACNENQTTIVPLCTAWALAHGPVTISAYQHIKDKIIEAIKDDFPVDAVYLALHGAMTVDGIDDPEGDLIDAVRSAVGTIPIVVSLDFHANTTRLISEKSDIIVGYNDFPHTHIYETGKKAALLLHRHFGQIKNLHRVFVKIPMINPQEKMTIEDNPPMKAIIDKAESFSREDGIVNVSVFGVQPWLDIKELGNSVIITVHRDHLNTAINFATELASDLWKNREYFFDFTLYSPKEAILQALEMEEQPIILNEPADNAGSGATGDSTAILRALLELKTKVPALVTICDPEAVSMCIRKGVGESIELNLGAKFNTRFDSPVHVRGNIRTIFDGRYQYRGPAQTGVTTSMGLTVVLEIEHTILVQITELPVYTVDPEHYRCMGLFPERMKLVGIKSQGSYKASYDAISKSVFYLDTPGLSRSNILKVPFTKVNTSQLYPFNRMIEYKPEPMVFCRMIEE